MNVFKDNAWGQTEFHSVHVVRTCGLRPSMVHSSVTFFCFNAASAAISYLISAVCDAMASSFTLHLFKNIFFALMPIARNNI